MPTPAPAAASYRFGGFELRPSERLLLSGGAPVVIGARAFDLLVALVERAGSLVIKDDLIDRVWPGLVVEDNNLQVQISHLRKALGPGAVATIPGRGYRFDVPLATSAPRGAAAARIDTAPTGAWPLSNIASHAVPLYGRDAD